LKHKKQIKMLKNLFQKSTVVPSQAPQETKGTLASKTVWGILLMVAGFISMTIHLDLVPVIKAAMAAHDFQAWIEVIGTLGAAILAYIFVDDELLPLDLFILSTMNCWLGGVCQQKDMMTFEICLN
jgi:hypothetical protein